MKNIVKTTIGVVATVATVAGAGLGAINYMMYDHRKKKGFKN